MSSSTRFQRRWYFLTLGILAAGMGYWILHTPPAEVMVNAPEIREAKDLSTTTEKLPSGYADISNGDGEHFATPGVEVEKGNRRPASN